MGNGSSKPGDALADQARDRFARARAEHRRAHGRASVPDLDADDTARIQAVMADSKAPAVTRGAVGLLAAFPVRHRLTALIVLSALILGLVALGAAKWLGPYLNSLS